MTELNDKIQEAWLNVERNALRLLEHAEEIQPRTPNRRLRALLRLWAYPSFMNWESWTVIQVRQDKPPKLAIVARRVAWNREKDFNGRQDPVEGVRRLSDQSPTIDFVECEISREQWESFFGTATSLTIPVKPIELNAGLDGTNFGYEYPDCFACVRLEWWEEGPKEWRPIVDWARQARKWLQERLVENK